jgi:hypothetical protein
MSNGAHALPSRPSFLSRALATRKRRILATVAFLMVLGSAAAWAVYLALAGITGGGKAGQFTLNWATSGFSLSPSSTASKTAPTVTGGMVDGLYVGAKASLPSDLVFFPSDHYEFSGKVGVTADGAPGWVTGVTMPGLPAGYTATLVNGCGAAVTPGGLPATVTVRIQANETLAADGKAFTLSGAGVQAMPQSQGAKPTSCPAYVGGSAA